MSRLRREFSRTIGLINEYGDLSDPYRQGQEAYERALARMDVILGEGWELLLNKFGVGGWAIERGKYYQSGEVYNAPL